MRNYQPSTPLRLLNLSHGERSQTMNLFMSKLTLIYKHFDCDYIFKNLRFFVCILEFG